MRISSARRQSAILLKSSSLIILALVATGCSGNVARFSDNFYTNAVPGRPPAPVQSPFPSANVNEPAPVYSAQPVYQPSPAPVYGAQPQYTAPTYGGVDRTVTGSVTPSNVSRTPLASPNATAPAPAPASSPFPSAPSAQSSAPVITPRPQTAAAAPMAAPIAEPVAEAATRGGEGWTKAGGTYVTMRSGETVYNMAKRYGVPANAIMEANGISNANAVQAGQKVLIPVYVYGANAPISAPDNNADVRAAKASIGGRSDVNLAQAPTPGTRPQSAPTIQAPVATKPSVSGGRYTVQSGDTLSAIARKTGSSIDAIRRTNNISGDAIRIGQNLTIPGQAGDLTSTKTAQAANIDPITTGSVVTQSAKKVVPYTPPSANAPQASQSSIVKIEETNTASAPANTGVGTMRWPATGRIVSSFGSNLGGKPNDGIDISLPRGTPVKAAENGVVIYAGDGLKELGNTILVRHGDGLVTVYGHVDTIKVARGDTVKRGQTIAASGMSGNAKQPQLHFEVRNNTKPVNPITYLN